MQDNFSQDAVEKHERSATYSRLRLTTAPVATTMTYR
jgi:hypothetical protein